MQGESHWGAHVRAGVGAALLLGVSQVVAETIAFALWDRGHVLAPYAFFTHQGYDYAAKLLGALGLGGLVSVGALGRFTGPGAWPKLSTAVALLPANVVVGVAVGIVVGTLRFWRRREANVRDALALVLIVALLVHTAGMTAAVHVPGDWTAVALARNAVRVVLWDRGGFALVVFAVSAVVALLVARLPRPATAGAAALAVAVVAAGAVAGRGRDARPAQAAPVVGRAHSKGFRLPVDNVVLISIDSLRADRLSAYGNPHRTSPTLDRLAREGTLFTDTSSTASWTLPAHMSLLTGRACLAHGVLTSRDRMPRSVVPLAEVLHRAGYATSGVISMEYLSRRYGFARGFDDYNEQAMVVMRDRAAQRSEPAPVTTRLAVDWITRHGGQRFFLFVHYWDVHYDYIPPAPYDRMFDPDYRGTITGEGFYYNPRIRPGMDERDRRHLLALYDGEIRWVDDHIARIVAALEEQGLWERTAVIVTADHGDEFLEHGGKGHHRLYREVIHVPLIMRIPGVKGGQVVSARTSLVDVMPTILDVLGIRAPTGLDGRSLLPLMRGVDPDPERPVYAEVYQKGRFDVKVMRYGPEGTLLYSFAPIAAEFYGPRDFAERRDVAGVVAHEQALASSLTRTTEWLNGRWAIYRSLEADRGEVRLDRATRERLRALGYGD